MDARELVRRSCVCRFAFRKGNNREKARRKGVTFVHNERGRMVPVVHYRSQKYLDSFEPVGPPRDELCVRLFV